MAMIGLLAKKVGMTQVYEESGRVVPVTVLTAGPCPVVQIKTKERDGYTALQIGFGTKREALIRKPIQGHLKKHQASGLRMLREIRVDDASAYEIGQKLDVSLFEVGSTVDVVGVISKGRGFAGVTKRHHFTGGRETHGCVTHKQPGSIGASAYPSRVIKGKRLPGRMGGGRVTVKNLGVIGVDAEQNLIWIRGSVPGHPNATVLIRQTKARA
jgi:large subunit ribosomal protein L3